MSTPLIMPLVTTSKLTNAWRSQRVMADGVNSGMKKNYAHSLSYEEWKDIVWT